MGSASSPRPCEVAPSGRSGTLGSPIRQTSFDDSRREPIAGAQAVDEVVNAHDATAIEGFTTNPAIAGELDGLLDAFPDLHFDVTWTVAEHDRVVAFLEMSGTHEGSWLMVQEGTHRPVRASIMLCLQLDEAGMVIDGWLGTASSPCSPRLAGASLPRASKYPSNPDRTAEVPLGDGVLPSTSIAGQRARHGRRSP